MTEVKPDVSVRPLREGDLSEADRIIRLAFGTFLGLPDPMTFMGDAGYVRTRWVAAPDAAFGAEVDGKLVGSNFATNWGSVGSSGPLTAEPDLWNKGIGSRLMEPIEESVLPIGVLGTRDYSPGPTARRTFTCTRSSDSGHGFSPRSCPSRSDRGCWKGG